MQFLFAIVATSAFLTGCLCALEPSTSDFTHSLPLLEEDKYHMFWKYDEETITFEVWAKSLGWVGFGVSPNGGMTGADLTISWVKDGQAYSSVSGFLFLLFCVVFLLCFLRTFLFDAQNFLFDLL